MLHPEAFVGCFHILCKCTEGESFGVDIDFDLRMQLGQFLKLSYPHCSGQQFTMTRGRLEGDLTELFFLFEGFIVFGWRLVEFDFCDEMLLFGS